MKKKSNPIYERNTLEFVTVALEYCAFVVHAPESGLFDFVDKSIKILPLLYLKATLLPELEEDEDVDLEFSVTEEDYETIRSGLSVLLGERDSFLDTFHSDMQYSDTPIAATISENLADVYQDIENFISLYREGNEEVMHASIIKCYTNFREFWGQKLLNALKALHTVRYSDEDGLRGDEKA